MKPHYQIPIHDCGEPLLPIPIDIIAVVSPHPYERLGAPYNGKSPYCLRQGVLDRLIQAQHALHQDYPDWRIQVFDAYRPIAVQRFMVNHALQTVAHERGLSVDALTPEQHTTLMQEVSRFWALPSLDPLQPPPHSTGAALDVTLINGIGLELAMGSPIDELSPRSYPDYFAPDSPHRPPSDATPPDDCVCFHQHRQILANAMGQAGFQRHPNEWWHFSFGDQLWAWLTRARAEAGEPAGVNAGAIARYGSL